MEPAGVTEVQYILTLFALILLIPSFIAAIFSAFAAAWLMIVWIASWEE